MRTLLHTLLACLLLAAFATPCAYAQSIELRLADGSRWRGEVGDQVEMRIMQRGVEVELQGRIKANAELHMTLEIDLAGQRRDRTIFKADILSIKTVTAPARPGSRTPGAAPSSRPSENRPASKETRPEAEASKGPGVFLLPFKGGVGQECRHQEIELIAQEADKYGPGQIIVLELDTPGGLVIEMEEIARVLMDVKRRHRIIAWVHQAISAGAATAAFCDEIYFTTQGALGSMTMVQGVTGVERSRQLQWALRAGEWFQNGGRSPHIAHAMVMQHFELSYDKDPITGRVTWYDNLQGEFVLSRQGQNLTFNSSNAVHSGFAQGVADTYEELAKLLHMPEWREVNDYGRRIHADWVRTYERFQQEVPRLIARLNYYRAGTGDPLQMLGARIQIMEQLAAWIRRAPRPAWLAGLPELEAFEREIADLRKQYDELRRAQRNQNPPRR